jgi:hypothetical protein
MGACDCAVTETVLRLMVDTVSKPSAATTHPGRQPAAVLPRDAPPGTAKPPPPKVCRAEAISCEQCSLSCTAPVHEPELRSLMPTCIAATGSHALPSGASGQPRLLLWEWQSVATWLKSRGWLVEGVPAATVRTLGFARRKARGRQQALSVPDAEPAEAAPLRRMVSFAPALSAKLLGYQRKGVAAFLGFGGRMLLADEMGLGKT